MPKPVTIADLEVYHAQLEASKTRLRALDAELKAELNAVSNHAELDAVGAAARRLFDELESEVKALIEMMEGDLKSIA